MTTIRLTITRTLDINLSDPPEEIGSAWAEQILEALRDDDPHAQIETSDTDTLVGAVVRCIEADVGMTIADFDILASDIQVEILPEAKPNEAKS